LNSFNMLNGGEHAWWITLYIVALSVITALRQQFIQYYILNAYIYRPAHTRIVWLFLFLFRFYHSAPIGCTPRCSWPGAASVDFFSNNGRPYIPDAARRHIKQRRGREIRPKNNSRAVPQEGFWVTTVL